MPGTAEVFTPMLSSVLTTCSVFVPLIFIGGMTGALFYDQKRGHCHSPFCVVGCKYDRAACIFQGAISKGAQAQA